MIPKGTIQMIQLHCRSCKSEVGGVFDVNGNLVAEMFLWRPIASYEEIDDVRLNAIAYNFPGRAKDRWGRWGRRKDEQCFTAPATDQEGKRCSCYRILHLSWESVRVAVDNGWTKVWL